MSQSLALCIGGKNDGKRTQLDFHYVSLPVLPNPVAYDPHAIPDPFASYEMERYRQIRLIGADGQQIKFYALEGLTDGQALQRLIDGYKPNPPAMSKEQATGEALARLTNEGITLSNTKDGYAAFDFIVRLIQKNDAEGTKR